MHGVLDKQAPGPDGPSAEEALRAEALFAEARRLRHRRWTGGTAVATALVCAACVGYLAYPSRTGPQVAGAGKSSAAVAAVAASLYFRPVYCTIAPATAAPSSSPATPPLSRRAAEHLCGEDVPRQRQFPTTGSAGDKPASPVVLPGPAGVLPAGRYVLGPAEMDGSVVRTAEAYQGQPTGPWAVRLSFTRPGQARFDHFAAQHYACYARRSANPPACALQALQLDGRVVTAPAIEAGSFPGGAMVGFPRAVTRAEAEHVAALVRAASAPAGAPAPAATTATTGPTGTALRDRSVEGGEASPVASAVARTEAARTAHFVVLTGQGSPYQVVATAKVGEVDFAHEALAMTLYSGTPSAKTRAAEVRQIGLVKYEHVTKGILDSVGWSKTRAARQLIDLQFPLDAVPAGARAVVVGHGRADGAVTTEYRLSEGASKLDSTRVPPHDLYLWLDSRGRIRRAQQAEVETGFPGHPGRLRFWMSMTFSDFGAPVAVRVPK